MSNIKSRILGRNQIKVSEISLGTASIGNLYKAVADADAAATMQAANSIGINYYDTAPYYGFGLAERRAGDQLRNLSRNDYVLSTKVGRLMRPVSDADVSVERNGFVSPMPFDQIYNYTYDGIMRSFEDSLQRLGVERIDILFVHDIGTLTHGGANAVLFEQLASSGYAALEELRESGMISSFGLGVNEVEVCEAALEHGDYDCFLLAGRYTLLEQDALNSFLPKCQQRDVSVVIGGAFNSGILAVGTRSLNLIHYNYGEAPEHIIAKVTVLEKLCEQYGVSLQAAAVQFPLAHPCTASVCLGMSQAKRVHQALDFYQEKIPVSFWQELKAMGLLHDDAPIPRH